MEYFMTRTLLILISALFVFNVLPAIAQDKAIPKTITEKLPVSAPVQKWIDSENAMIDPLNKDQKESVYILRHKYSIIRAIGVVKRDIDKAVTSCVKENPDIKKSMEDRFTQWKNAVDPIIKTAEKQLNVDIDAQKIVEPKAFRSVMTLSDKAFKYDDSKIEKKPVSTKEACGGLLESMNDTENNMIKLLREALLPESVIKSRDKMNKKEQRKIEEIKTKSSEDKKPQ